MTGAYGGRGDDVREEGERTRDAGIDIDWSRLVPLEGIRFANDEHREETESLYAMAAAYVHRQSWCEAILQVSLGLSEAGLIGVFFLQVQVRDKGPQWVWVVVGDIPPLCIGAQFARNQYQALNSYLGEVGRWLELVEQEGDASTVAQVDHGTSPEELAILKRKLDVLDENLLEPAKHLL